MEKRSVVKAGRSRLSRRSRRKADRNLPEERGRSRHLRGDPDLDPETRRTGGRTDAPEDLAPGKSGETDPRTVEGSVLATVLVAGLHPEAVVANLRQTAGGENPVDRRPEKEKDQRKGKRNPEALRHLNRQSLLQRNATCAPCCACSCLPRCASAIFASSCRRWASSATSASSQTLGRNGAEASPTSSSNHQSRSLSRSDSPDKSFSEYPFKFYHLGPRKTAQRRTTPFKGSIRAQ